MVRILETERVAARRRTFPNGQLLVHERGVVPGFSLGGATAAAFLISEMGFHNPEDNFHVKQRLSLLM